jgi:hypothetical protein
MTTFTDFREVLRVAGLTVRVVITSDGPHLSCRPKSAITPDLDAGLRTYRDALIADLTTRTPKLAPTPARVPIVETFTTGPWNERCAGLASCYCDPPHLNAFAYHRAYSRLLCTICHGPTTFSQPIAQWRGLPVYHLDFRPEGPCTTCGTRTWGNLPGVGILCWTCKSRGEAHEWEAS